MATGEWKSERDFLRLITTRLEVYFLALRLVLNVLGIFAQDKNEVCNFPQILKCQLPHVSQPFKDRNVQD